MGRVIPVVCVDISDPVGALDGEMEVFGRTVSDGTRVPGAFYHYLLGGKSRSKTREQKQGQGRTGGRKKFFYDFHLLQSP
jgi:hypothetical protein